MEYRYIDTHWPILIYSQPFLQQHLTQQQNSLQRHFGMHEMAKLFLI